MNQKLKQAYRSLREFIATWPESRVIEAYAFNKEGKMIYNHGCRCVRGLAEAETLHVERCEGDHYHKANSQLAYTAEVAYYVIGLTAFPPPPGTLGDDGLRQRRMSPILRAEMRRRFRLRQVEVSVEPELVAV